MPSYRIVWEFDTDADSHREAARNAWNAMRRADSIANVFSVSLESLPGDAVTVDLGLRYVATMNTPGYLPMDDDPAEFGTTDEAWQYLADERRRSEDDLGDWTDHECNDPNACGYTGTVGELEANAAAGTDVTGSVVGATPGYEGTHDLGMAYSVSEIQD